MTAASTMPKDAAASWSLPLMSPQSLGAGDLSTQLDARLRKMYARPPSAAPVKSSLVFQVAEDDKRVRLFNASSALKIATSQVSMHLSPEWRRRLFEKIDNLHDPDEWDDSDRLTQLDSFKTFLRTILQLGPLPRMSIGISHEGHVLAGWKTGEDTLSLEFLPQDDIRWSVVRYADGNRESAAGRTSLQRLLDVLQPYSPEIWLGNDNKIPAS